jgi:hypothetical protein
MKEVATEMTKVSMFEIDHNGIKLKWKKWETFDDFWLLKKWGKEEEYERKVYE